MATSKIFWRLIEIPGTYQVNFPGATIIMTRLHDHGSNSIKWPGLDLTITHESLQHDVRSLFHGRQSGRLRSWCSGKKSRLSGQCHHDQTAAADVGTVLRRRPTISPFFFDAVARKLGYNSVQAATNGIEFAKSTEFSKRAKPDCVMSIAVWHRKCQQHRKVGNLFDVKLKAIENCHNRNRDHSGHDAGERRLTSRSVRSLVALNSPHRIAFICLAVSFWARRGSHRRAPPATALRFRTWRTM